jgi:hypothetical protein
MHFCSPCSFPGFDLPNNIYDDECKLWSPQCDLSISCHFFCGFVAAIFSLSVYDLSLMSDIKFHAPISATATGKIMLLYIMIFMLLNSRREGICYKLNTKRAFLELKLPLISSGVHFRMLLLFPNILICHIFREFMYNDFSILVKRYGRTLSFFFLRLVPDAILNPVIRCTRSNPTNSGTSCHVCVVSVTNNNGFWIRWLDSLTFRLQLQPAHNQWLLTTCSIPYWNPSVLSSTVTNAERRIPYEWILFL